MGFLKNSFLLLKQIFSFGVYALSFLFLRSKKLWLYGNVKGSFRDNAKYFFIYNSTHFPEIKHVWVSQSQEVLDTVRAMGFVAVHKFSFKAFYYALTAKAYIYNGAPTDTVHGCMRGTAYCFNLWHGVPFKKIEYDINKGSFYKSFFNPTTTAEKIESFLFEPKAFRNSDGILAPSAKLVDLFAKAFQLNPNQVFIGPYPRNEVFAFSKNELHEFIEKYESPAFKKLCKELAAYKAVVIYMPTFRDNDPDFMAHAIPDFEKLHSVCKSSNTLFLIKAHPLTVFNTDLSSFTHIKSLDNQMDIYPLLPLTHALVSDYSSIFFDYSLLGKKMIFYAFDKDEYFQKNRDAYFEYEDVFAKEITQNFNSLLKEIEQLNPAEKQRYPLSRPFVESNVAIADITNHIKNAIKFQ